MTDEQEFVVIYGDIKVFRPDMRQYRQNSLEIVLGDKATVAVSIPKTPEHFFTYDPLVLTPTGLKYISDQFDKVFGVEVSKEVKEDEWEEKTEKKAEKVKESADDGWDTDNVFESEKKEEPINKPDTEVWNEKDESW